MVLWDVNLLLHAAMPASPRHRRCRDLLEIVLDAPDPFAASQLILSSVVRIATNPKAFDPPASREQILAFCNAILDHPRAVRVTPGLRHWRIFEDLLMAARVRGADVTDAYLAALAMEHGREFWSADTGFARFPGLRWHNPLQ